MRAEGVRRLRDFRKVRYLLYQGSKFKVPDGDLTEQRLNDIEKAYALRLFYRSTETSAAKISSFDSDVVVVSRESTHVGRFAGLRQPLSRHYSLLTPARLPAMKRDFSFLQLSGAVI